MVARIVFGILLAVTAGSGQTPDGLPRFDTISVKVAGAYVPGQSVGVDGSAAEGRITYLRQNLVSLLALSYGVMIDQVVAPDWMHDRQTAGTYSYNVAVTLPRDTSEDQVHAMLRNLLTNHFRLTLHHETRDFPSYELIVAPGGPHLTDVGPNIGHGKAGGVTSGGMVRLEVSGLRMDRFVEILGDKINESNEQPQWVLVPRVFDKTGLTDAYDFTLAFKGWEIMPGKPLTSRLRANVNPDAARLPDLFGALETELGLKLVKVADVPLDVLVIDHADPVADGN